MTDQIQIYTDGACKGNPGPGGWGALLEYKGRKLELFGGEDHTTNNRMELRAVIEGLSALKRRSNVLLVTDSKYVMQGMQQWLAGWKKRGWKTAGKQPVKNQDLWQQLDALVQQHDVQWQWVAGHAGHRGNERADELANKGVDEVRT